jgi:hypothetical protein
MKKYFLVYNDTTHIEHMLKLLNSVKMYGKDFEIIIFNKTDICPEFVEKNKEILNCSRGGGYWLWKPYIISKTLDEKLQEGDLLFYIDSKYFFLEDFTELYEEKMKTCDILAWKNKPNTRCYIMREWCKMDVIQAFNIYDDVFKENMEIGWAGAIMIKKNEKTQQIMREWLDKCSNYHFITDSPSILKNSEYFVDHRHDQSILSIILYLHGISFEFFECKYLQNVRQPFHV